jgi:phage terminase small subunit
VVGAQAEGQFGARAGWGEEAANARGFEEQLDQCEGSRVPDRACRTCNVTQAAAEAGVSSSAAYKRRKENAAFRAAWLEAISVAYQRLELVLLERAFNGTEKLVKRRDGSEERMLEYSNQLGLTLLKMHRDTAVEASIEMAPDQIEELRERLFNKFKRLKQRDQSGDESA